MDKNELKNTIVITTIMALRMLGLFMVIPILTPYAQQLKLATPELLGLAIGIYGLTQALLQFPMGYLSDHYGRKTIIALGLLVLILGSLIAGYAQNIVVLLIGRALQGAGAIGSVLMALLADISSEQHRTKAMAIVGISIGGSFTLGMIIGPILSIWLNVNGLFYLTALLGLFALLLLYFKLPTVEPSSAHQGAGITTKHLFSLISDPQLLTLNLGIFVLHAVLAATFVVLPIQLTQNEHIIAHQQWLVYSPILLLSAFVLFPLIRFAEKKHKVSTVYLSAIGLLSLTQLQFYYFQYSLLSIVITLFLFFCAFNFLEANLPSMVSKLAPTQRRGAAIGLFSSCQFLGIFCGGGFAGWLYGQHSLASIYIFNFLLALVWFMVSILLNKRQVLRQEKIYGSRSE